MSLFPIGLALQLAEQLGLLPAIFLFQRNVGGFVADATLEEIHHDELKVTEHPVQQGASVVDHSYKAPAKVVIRAGWSNSSLSALGNPNYVRDVYDDFLQLQASRQPFDILTGKRAYRNMLMTRLSTETSARTENSLVLTVECMELILVSTQTITVPNDGVMKNPGTNGADQNVGVKGLKPKGNYNEVAAGGL